MQASTSVFQARLFTKMPITAVVYREGWEVENLLASISDDFNAAGLLLAGFVQRDRPRDDRHSCDMLLEDVATGAQISISEDRGAGARGCKLDVSALLKAGELARSALAGLPDLLVINKFGKTEHEGGGLRDLIVEAVAMSVPVLIAVPERNIESWLAFSEGLANNVFVTNLPQTPVGRFEALGLSVG